MLLFSFQSLYLLVQSFFFLEQPSFIFLKLVSSVTNLSFQFIFCLNALFLCLQKNFLLLGLCILYCILDNLVGSFLCNANLALRNLLAVCNTDDNANQQTYDSTNHTYRINEKHLPLIQFSKCNF